jgi:hypothetical protein
MNSLSKVTAVVDQWISDASASENQKHLFKWSLTAIHDLWFLPRTELQGGSPLVASRAISIFVRHLNNYEI